MFRALPCSSSGVLRRNCIYNCICRVTLWCTVNQSSRFAMLNKPDRYTKWRYQRLHIYNYDVDLLKMSRVMLETCRVTLGDWEGPRAVLDCRKISPPPGFEPRTIQPIASRYTDWAILAHYIFGFWFKYLFLGVGVGMSSTQTCVWFIGKRI